MKPARRFDSFSPYTPIEPFEVLSEKLGLPVDQIVKLDANENPYGMSPTARQALTNLAFPNIYPDPEARALRNALAKFTGLPAERLLAGAGADELIDLILRVMIEPADIVLNLPPTFGMYAFDTLLNAGQVVEVPRQDDFSVNLRAVEKTIDIYHPKILFLTNPNNPDGSLVERNVLLALLEMPLLVVIDEAYIEFSEDGGRLGERLSMLSQVMERENLVVLRTFSKWAGLAGLRVGYGAFPAWLLPVLWKAKQPYNVNVAASTAAIASLSDLETLADNVEKIRRERTRLYAKLQQVACLEPISSQANFILCRVKGQSALSIKESLSARGVLVRYYNSPNLQNFIRISVGRPQDTDKLIECLNNL